MCDSLHINAPIGRVGKRAADGRQKGAKRAADGRQNSLISGTKSDLSRRLRDGVLFITDYRAALCPYRHMRAGAH
jgi:hypothetical protein